MTLAIQTRVSLELGCCPDAVEHFGSLFVQLTSGRYDDMAVLELPDAVWKWRDRHRTARKRADRATRRGYHADLIRREKHADEIMNINLSAPSRQGRPMDAGYRERPSEEPLPEFGCERHAITAYGVTNEAGSLVAYAVIHRAGQLALVSQILGHRDHLENEIMYLLIEGIVQSHGPHGGYLVYNRYDSGTDGLRFFKDRCGFLPTPVAWAA